MKEFARGLIVGKFSPLHQGHEWLIRSAQARCEELILFSYSNPEFPGCEPPHRREWLKALFPEAISFVIDGNSGQVPPNDAPDDIQREFVAQLYLKLVNRPLDAVFTSEAYGDGFVRHLNHFFKTKTTLPARVRHIHGDPARIQVAARGSTIRADVHAHRHLLSPEVYRSFVKRICFLGGESTGKSTITERLAQKYRTSHVAEYGRTLWDERGGILTYEDMLLVARTQVQNEEAGWRQAHRMVFIDTSPLTTLLYCEHLFGKSEPEQRQLALRTYDRIYLCAPDFPFVQDGTRTDAKFRDWQHQRYLEMLAERGMTHQLLTGSLEQRIATVEAIDDLKGGV
jgi:HTH-type transcriptional repressor of NAD biosynthesis genes